MRSKTSSKATKIARQSHTSRSLPSSQHARLSSASARPSAKLNGPCVLQSSYSRSLCRPRMSCVYRHILKYKNEKGLGSQQFYLARVWIASRLESACSRSHRPALIECSQIHLCPPRRIHRQSVRAVARKLSAKQLLLRVSTLQPRAYRASEIVFTGCMSSFISAQGAVLAMTAGVCEEHRDDVLAGAEAASFELINIYQCDQGVRIAS